MESGVHTRYANRAVGWVDHLGVVGVWEQAFEPEEVWVEIKEVWW